MNFLITGGTGFNRSGAGQRLVAQGHDVRVIDTRGAGGERNVLDSRALFYARRCGATFRNVVLLNGVDCVFHLAARVSVPESVLYPVEYNDVNVRRHGQPDGGRCAMRASRRVVLASSGAIYGEQPLQPVAESATVNRKRPTRSANSPPNSMCWRLARSGRSKQSSCASSMRTGRDSRCRHRTRRRAALLETGPGRRFAGRVWRRDTDARFCLC